MDELYLDNILDHARNPHNKEILNPCSCVGYGKNPSCGDNGTLYLNIESEIINKATFVGEGCAISQAGMSMITDELLNKKVEAAKNMMPGDIYKMLGVQITPSRAACALLCYNALEEALKDYAKNK